MLSSSIAFTDRCLACVPRMAALFRRQTLNQRGATCCSRRNRRPVDRGDPPSAAAGPILKSWRAEPSSRPSTWPTWRAFKRPSSPSTPTRANQPDHCTISGNSATQSGGGGGIFAQDIALTIDHSTVSGNSASGSGGNASTGNSGSTSARGGGIGADGGSLSVDHSTINDPAGSGIVNVGSSIHVKKSAVDGVWYDDVYFP